MEPLEQRRQEVLDGKRSWGVEEAGGDKDVFFTEFVVPLRKLRGTGMIEKLIEERINADGDSYVGIVEILGAIDFTA
jgi:hypothetical protein